MAASFRPTRKLEAVINGDSKEIEHLEKTRATIIEMEALKQIRDSEMSHVKYERSINLDYYDDEDSLTTGKAGEILNRMDLFKRTVNNTIIRDWIKEGTLKGTKEGQTWEILKKDLVQFINNHK